MMPRDVASQSGSCDFAEMRRLDGLGRPFKRQELLMIPPRDLSNPQSIREQGWCAYHSGVDARHCPYVNQVSRDAWLFGHEAAAEWFAHE